jgi:hypothetical protein
MVVGNGDPYLTPERMEEFEHLSNKLGIKPEKIVFDGKHELNEDVLLKFAAD